jgi:hypothetical protein
LSLLPGEIVYGGDDFALGREPIQGLFRKDQLAIDFHFENSATGRDELRGDLELSLDFISQTGRLGSVVSNLAILDGDLHGDPSRQRSTINQNWIRGLGQAARVFSKESGENSSM